VEVHSGRDLGYGKIVGARQEFLPPSQHEVVEQDRSVRMTRAERDPDTSSGRWWVGRLNSDRRPTVA